MFIITPQKTTIYQPNPFLRPKDFNSLFAVTGLKKPL
jgi:hypothetical protein